MNKLKKFKLNIYEKNSDNSVFKIKKFIELFFKNKEAKTLINHISSALDIKISDIELKAKKILYEKYSYKENKFNNFSSISKIFFHFFAFFIILLKTFTFKKNLSSSKKKKIACFGVETVDEIVKYKNILKYFNDSIIVTSRKLKFNNSRKYFHNDFLRNGLKINYNKNILSLVFKNNISKNLSFKTEILNEREIILDKNCLKKKKLEIIKLVLIYFILSLKKKVNYLMFINIILYSYLKNYSIFSRYSCDVIIIDRIFLSCPIRNAIFKKFGGKSSVSLQSHLSEKSISFYNQVDIYFSFGNELYSKKILNNLGSDIKETIPAGSILLENYYYNFKNKTQSNKKIDILVLGVNKYNWFYANKNTQKNYYKYYFFLKLLSEKYKNIKIYIKHHPNNLPDQYELSILKNSKIKYLDKEKNSYSFIKNSKLFLSFSSTLIQEIYSIKQSSFFIDPDNNNFLFFRENLNLNKIKINNFKKLCAIVESYLFKKNKKKKTLAQDICLKSKNTSQIIIKKILKEI